MKRYFILAILVLLTSAASYAWKPTFVGHRGSYRGVQNTVEAYTNGVEYYHYEGLECDVRVTSDGHYVILHDETTGSLCDENLTVATSTLAQLKALTFKQTRGGVTYTGQICTVEEYLDICAEHDVFPMIELKWTTGINNNDMSKFPGLWNLVTARGLESKAIFLTSMQNSLKYIHQNYPQATCQYLLSSDSDAKLDFCRTNKINPSFEASAVTAALVQRYREVGLEVAAWTVNSLANYRKYGQMGVFMMTCDYLMPGDMPELDEPGEVEPPQAPVELETSTIWLRSRNGDNLPTNFPSKSGATYKTGEMAAVVDGKFYVSDYGTKSILVFDRDSTEPVVIPQSDTSFGGSAMHGITTDDAQNIILRYEESINATPSKVRLFKYGTNVPVEVDFTINDGGGNHFIAASGDVFSEEGGYLYFLPNTKTTVSIVHIANGEFKQLIEHKNLSATGSAASVIIPIEGPNKYIYMVRNQGFFLFNNVDKGSLLTSGSSTTAPARNSSCGGAYMVISGHEILAHPSGFNYNGGFTLRDMSAFNEPLVTFDPIGTGGYDHNASTGTFIKPVKIAEDVYEVYHYTMGHGYGVYEVKAKGAGIEAAPVAQEAKLTVFPNPVTTITAISSAKALGLVEVFSLDGRRVLVADFGEDSLGRLDMSGLPAGLYVAVTADGRRTKIAKR